MNRSVAHAKESGCCLLIPPRPNNFFVRQGRSCRLSKPRHAASAGVVENRLVYLAQRPAGLATQFVTQPPAGRPVLVEGGGRPAGTGQGPHELTDQALVGRVRGDLLVERRYQAGGAAVA